MFGNKKQEEQSDEMQRLIETTKEFLNSNDFKLPDEALEMIRESPDSRLVALSFFGEMEIMLAGSMYLNIRLEMERRGIRPDQMNDIIREEAKRMAHRARRDSGPLLVFTPPNGPIKA